MVNLRTLDKHRLDMTASYGWSGNDKGGAFAFKSPADGRELRVIASAELGWDHVSVSRADRCPTWDEMEFIKRKFFNKEECVVQYHVPEAKHINRHPNCLHLWRPHAAHLPMPPQWMV